MRSLRKSMVRGLVVVSVIGALGMPAMAAPREDRDPRHSPIYRFLKHVITTLGDLLTDPKP